MKAREDRNLAEGETTGHHHVVLEADAVVYGDGNERELHAPSGATVTHEEHKTFRGLPAGDYEVNRQREIDPDTDEARAVCD